MYEEPFRLQLRTIHETTQILEGGTYIVGLIVIDEIKKNNKMKQHISFFSAPCFLNKTTIP